MVDGEGFNAPNISKGTQPFISLLYFAPSFLHQITYHFALN